MCLFNEAELYCVNTNILLKLLFIQLLIGISTKRYLPAIGTAGLLRLAVRGCNLVPAPPPSITAITDFVWLSILGSLVLKLVIVRLKTVFIKFGKHLCNVVHYCPNYYQSASFSGA